jgi:hydrogenase-4 membrane subunit HyfE
MQISPHIGSQLVDLCSALLLLTCFAIVAQRRLSACVDLFALQSAFLVLTAALVAFLTGNHHIYIAAALTGLIKVVIIPRVLKKVIERLNVKRELVMNVNVPAGLLICGALVMLAFFIRSPSSRWAAHHDSLAIALAHRIFHDDRPAKTVTQLVGFLVMENGLFLEPRPPGIL